MKKWCFLSFLFFFLFGGCDNDEKKTGKKTGDVSNIPSLTVLCGSSFLKPMEELCAMAPAEAGVKCAISTAGSEEFLALIRTGRQGDLIVSHDPYLDTMQSYGVLDSSIHVGYVAPVLAVRSGNPENLSSLRDLKRPELRVGLTDPNYSTCGEMVFKLLERKGWKEEIMANVGNRLTKGHNNLGTLLETDAIDVAIMWNGVANTFGKNVDIIPTPYEYEQEIRVHVMGLNYSRHPEAVARFLNLVKQSGTEVFAKHGYIK